MYEYSPHNIFSTIRRDATVLSPTPTHRVTSRLVFCFFTVLFFGYGENATFNAFHKVSIFGFDFDFEVLTVKCDLLIE